MKTLHILIFPLALFSANMAYAETCFPGVFECELSEWFSFFVGDIIIAIMLGTLLFYLERRGNKKVDKTTSVIQKILRREEESRKWRMVTAARLLKERFNIILISAGLAVSATDQETKQECARTINKAANNAHGVVDMIVGVFDPELVNDLYRFTGSMNQLTETSVKYENLKVKIKRLSARVDSEISKPV